jgi:hypothetical protein
MAVERDIHNLSNDIMPKIQEINSSIMRNLARNTSLLEQTRQLLYSNIQDNNKEIFSKLERIESLLDSLLTLPLSEPNSLDLTHKIEMNDETENVLQELTVPVREIDEIILQFNHQNVEYFSHSRFSPLTLTDNSIRGMMIDGRRVLELKTPTDSAQAIYLRFEIDKENWLIPNITSPYIRQIMRNMSENPEIFTVHSGSGILQLVKPAKLKLAKSKLFKIAQLGLWKIEESGIFEANEENTEPSQQNIKKSMTDEMVEQFNSLNLDYFRDDKFQPLTLTQRAIDGQVQVRLTQQSVHGQVVLNGHRILQLEAPSDRSQASSLTTEIDKENFLIPNITSVYIRQIMNNLEENPEIFAVESGSGILRLVKPAKLKSVSSGLWEIEEPGIFQSNERNTEPIKQNTKVNVEQKQPVSSGHNPVNTPAEWAELVEQFNSRNTNYFENSKHRFLSLTKASVESSVGRNMRRTLQFEISPDNSSPAFLQVELDNNQWLIPNILSSSFERSFNNLVTTDYLRKNAGIFTVLNTNSLIKSQLVRPAKLIEIMTGVWQVAEPGEFRQ